MKRLFLGLTAIAMFSLYGFSNYHFDAKKTNNSLNTSTGKIHIIFHGGTICWLPGAACEGEILVEWRSAPPSDISGLRAPEGYQLISMETFLFGKASKTFAERTFSDKETSDLSTIYIPAQEGHYSKKLDAFVLYAKRIK